MNTLTRIRPRTFPGPARCTHPAVPELGPLQPPEDDAALPTSCADLPLSASDPKRPSLLRLRAASRSRDLSPLQCGLVPLSPQSFHSGSRISWFDRVACRHSRGGRSAPCPAARTGQHAQGIRLADPPTTSTRDFRACARNPRIQPRIAFATCELARLGRCCRRGDQSERSDGGTVRVGRLVLWCRSGPWRAKEPQMAITTRLGTVVAAFRI